MLILTSPAKTLDFESSLPMDVDVSHVRHLDQVAVLVDTLRPLSMKKLENVLDVSANLAALNYERYQSWDETHTLKNSRPALYTYQGDVFQQLELQKYSQKSLSYTQESLRIISGLYGVVRPFDLIQPYRLEMKLDLSSVSKSIGKLNEYWQVSVTADLQSDVINYGHTSVLNLASREYSKSVAVNRLSVPMVTVNFLYERKGSWKSIGILAKKARGHMIDWLIRKRVKDIDTVVEFNEHGYLFDPTQSNDFSLTFLKSGV